MKTAANDNLACVKRRQHPRSIRNARPVASLHPLDRLGVFEVVVLASQAPEFPQTNITGIFGTHCSVGYLR